MPDAEAVESSAESGADRRRAAGGSVRRRRVSVGRVLLVGVVCCSLWTFFDVRMLENSANASPLGVPRPGALTLSAARSAGGEPGHRTRKPAPLKGPPPLSSPTTVKPLTILEIGDSLGEDLGFGLADELGGDLRVHLLQNAVGDTGLSNEGYFDWPATLAQQLQQYHPQLVVVLLGGNDWQGFIANGQVAFTGTKFWTSVYTQRVDEMMSEATAAGAHVLWVGLPIMQDPTFGSHMAYLNAIYISQAKRYRGVVFIPTWKLFSNSAGQYAEFLPNASGTLIEVRDPDGVHIDPGGGTDLLGDYVLRRIEGIWHIKL